MHSFSPEGAVKRGTRKQQGPPVPQRSRSRSRLEGAGPLFPSHTCREVTGSAEGVSRALNSWLAEPEEPVPFQMASAGLERVLCIVTWFPVFFYKQFLI